MARLFTLPAGRIGKFVVLAVVVLLFIGRRRARPASSRAPRRTSRRRGCPRTPSRSRRSRRSSSTRAASSRPRWSCSSAATGLTEADRQRIDETVAQAQRATARRCVLEAQEPVFSQNGKAALIVQPVQPGEGVGDTFEDARAVDPRPGGRPARTASRSRSRARPATASTRSRSSAASTARCCWPRRASCCPADRHLPLADLLGDPVLRGRARRGRVARRRLPAGRGGRDDQRPDRRHPARARLRRRHRLRAAARVPLPRGAAPPRGQARGGARSRCASAGPAILASG